MLRAAPGVLLRLSLGVMALVLKLDALLVGAVLTIGLLAWAPLRGRRLAPGSFGATFQRSRRRQQAQACEHQALSLRFGARLRLHRQDSEFEAQPGRRGDADQRGCVQLAAAKSGNPQNLVDHLNMLLGGRMSPTLRQAVLQTVSSVNPSSQAPPHRARAATFLVLASPQYLSQR